MYIYALVDPRDRRIYYVGKTVKPIRRYKSHLSDLDGPVRKVAWIKELAGSGLRPTFAVLERDASSCTEAAWIARMTHEGHPLTNVQRVGKFAGFPPFEVASLEFIDPLGEDAEALLPPVGAVCLIEGCQKPTRARGWCEGHYKKWRKYGDALGRSEKRIVGDNEARFFSKVNKEGPIPEDRPDLGRCWVWVGQKTHSYRDEHSSKWTYGFLSVGRGKGRRNMRAHRYAYEMLVGSIPEGLFLDHLCRNTLCVNPAHLEPVSNKENTVRGRAAETNKARQLAKTHCKRGHALSGDNLHIARGNGQRVCRACKCIRAREERERKKREKVAHLLTP